MALTTHTYRHGEDIPDRESTNIFHSKRLFRMYETTPHYAPIMVTASRDGAIAGRLLGVVHRIMPFVKRCDIFGYGEYTNGETQPEEVFSAMIEALSREAFKTAQIIEVRNLDNQSFGYKQFREMKFFPVRWLRVRNSLHSQISAEARLSQSRLRQIRKGLKNGATIETLNNQEDVKELSRLINRICPAGGFFPNIELFIHSGEKMIEDEQARVFAVKYGGHVIGGSACVYSNDVAYLWFSGGMRKLYAMQHPGILAVWAALKDAFDRGISHLEFMDVGLPFRRHGYRDFIIRFGGKQSSTRRWFKFRVGWINRLLIKIFV